MSAGVDPGASSSGGGPSGDFDLNLAPIIDCLTVLIAFMLASFTAISIGLLDAGVSAASATPDKTQPPSVSLFAELKPDFSIEFKMTGKANVVRKIASLPDHQWNFEALTQELTAAKSKYADATAITLSAANDVEYGQLVLSMDQIRKTIPVVMLGGF